MTSPLYPKFEKRIDDATLRLIRTQVEPWNFIQRRLKLQTFDGRTISYEGIGFEGSPRHVFWSRFIEPFLEDIVVNELTAAIASAKKCEVDARVLLPEVQGLLLSSCRRTLQRMADVDRRLLGQGFPESVPLRSIEREYAAMREFIEKHVQAELAMWKSRPAYELWYERNKFWVWAVGTVLAVASLTVKFL